MVGEIGRRKPATRTKDASRTSSENGYALYFMGDRVTLEEVFGDEPIGPAEMTRRLWEHIRDRVPYEKTEVSDAEAKRRVEADAVRHRHRLTETEKTALVLSRRGQGRFRVDLIKWWGSTCAVTGCSETRLLRASHLKPWKPSTNAQRLDPFNGLLLAPHLDALLDCGLITFANDGRIQVSSSLASVDGKCLGIRRTMKLRRVDRRHLPYLRFHRYKVFQQ